jgi:hypothetical protein
VNLIERITLQMGSRWSASGPNEIGIDGYIELFDPNSHHALGLTFAVQSKVVTAITNAARPSFDYWCDANDLDYWLNGNMPVILVISNPATNEAYWVSIRDHFRNWKQNDSTRITFVKEDSRFDVGSFHRLLKVAAPKGGLYLAPMRRTETLHSNLLKLEHYPSRLFIADSDCRTARDVWALLRKTQGEVDGAWLLSDKKIISFHDLRDKPWSLVCDIGTAEGFTVAEWVKSYDLQGQRLFVQLLNQTLRAQLSPQVRYWPQEDCYAITGMPHKLSYNSLKRLSKITVVSRFSSSAVDGRHFERFRHLAFRGQFKPLDGFWYLEITPTYRFTRDGSVLDRFHSERLKGIKRLEGNRAVLSSILFWADYLKPRTTLFNEAPPPLQFGELAQFECAVGISDRDWLAVDPEFTRTSLRESKALLLPDFEEENDR